MKTAAAISTIISVLGVLDLTEAHPVAKNASCSVLIHGGLAEPQPLILWPGANATFAYPQETGTGSIVLSAGESLRLVCLGNAFAVRGLTSVSDAIATCVEGSTFSFDIFRITEAFENIACSRYPTHTARRTGVACPNGELCEIGFDLGDDGFKTLMTACHDDVNQNTILVHAKVPAVIDAAQRSFPRPGFVKGTFYVGISMATIYTRVNQRATLAKILGSEELALSYLPATGTLYWARGHLAAKTDFIYGSHQRSTFYYLNAVPQWQSMNAGNWATLEGNVKSLATNRNSDLDVYTGSMGVLTLADVNGVHQEVYLYVDDNNNKAVPVPKLFFKVVFEAKSGEGAVFISANNPYLETLTSDYVVCDDVSDRITYLTWNPTSSTRGLSYVCEVDDFRKAFPDLPRFTTTGLLK